MARVRNEAHYAYRAFLRKEITREELIKQCETPEILAAVEAHYKKNPYKPESVAGVAPKTESKN